MKYLILILISLALLGCKSESEKNQDACTNNLSKCVLVETKDLSYFNRKCSELATCMKAEFEIIHFNGQPSNPFACSISKKGKTRAKNWYFYPKADLSFSEARFSGLDNEINVCELMTETGRHSDERYASMDKIFDEIDKKKADREKPKPLEPLIKIREL